MFIILTQSNSAWKQTEGIYVLCDSYRIDGYHFTAHNSHFIMLENLNQHGAGYLICQLYQPWAQRERWPFLSQKTMSTQLGTRLHSYNGRNCNPSGLYSCSLYILFSIGKWFILDRFTDELFISEDINFTLCTKVFALSLCEHPFRSHSGNT